MTALKRRGLIATHRHGTDGGPPWLFAPIGTLGYPRQVGHVLRDTLLFNTHYFVFDPRELDSPLAAIGDPIGMLARGGRIRQPPILRRAALIHAGGRWQVERLGVDDLAIDLPDGTVVEARASAADAGRTRAGRVGIGVTRDGGLVILAIEGTSSLSAANPDAPTGCTMTELAEALLEAGAVDALNCDGGGSTQVFAGPGELLGSTDARAVVGGRFDRPVPVVGVVA